MNPNKFKIEFSGKSLFVNAQKNLLDGILEEGHAFPHSCKVGTCAQCRCELLSGEVVQTERGRSTLNLKPSQQPLTEGGQWILACQSTAQSDLVLKVDLEKARFQKLIPKNKMKATPWTLFLHHLKFALFHVVGTFVLGSLMIGGAWIPWALLTVILFYVLGDAYLGEDTSEPDFLSPIFLRGLLWSALPLLTGIVFLSIWQLTQHSLSFLEGVSCVLLTSLMIGLIGTIPGHELTHRVWDKKSMIIGRWLLAFSYDTSFSIEHVYGHHLYVATKLDPATAPTGRTVYAHILISTFKGNLSAWKIESLRLQGLGLSRWSCHNQFLRGQAMSLLLLLVSFLIFGVWGAVYFSACALGGKSLLEIVNYMEHYGLERDPSEPVEPKHSWNSNKKMSSWSTFNLTRHSHHHADGNVPFHQLQAMPQAPTMAYGYLTMILLTLIPPVWFRLHSSD